jgi:serine protease Do
MRFYRLLLCLLLATGVWEFFRADIIDILNKVMSVKSSTVEDTSSNALEPTQAQAKIAPQDVDHAAADQVRFLEEGFSRVARKARNSVVSVAVVVVEKNGRRGGVPDTFRSPFDDFFRDFFGGDFPEFQRKQDKPKKSNALGSGFIVKVTPEEAFIVTNNHVVDNASDVVITLSDKTELPAEVHAKDPRTDLAVLKAKLINPGTEPGKIVPLEWGESEAVEAGQWVIAIGNPFGLGNTVTSGIISAKNRNVLLGSLSGRTSIEDFIQHSAPINVGNSGGCLLNISGKVIGVNNAIFTTNGGNVGVGFAIPSSIAKTTIEQLIEHGRTFRGWLGAEIHPVDEEQAMSVGLVKKRTLDKSKVYGAFVSKLVPDGPAEKGGIKVGDIITGFDGKGITEQRSLQMAVGTTKIGNEAEVKVWRQKKKGNWGEVVLSVKVGDFEAAAEEGRIDTGDADHGGKKGNAKNEATVEDLGITVANISERYKNKYSDEVKVFVIDVDEDKCAPFRVPPFGIGDGIISANGEKVTSASHFAEIMKKIPESARERPIPYVLERNGSRTFVAATLPKKKKAG